MKRRALLLTMASTSLGSALHTLRAYAQAGNSPRRIGVLAIGNSMSGRTNVQELQDGLREHGFAPGRDIVLEGRWGRGRTEALANLAAELVALKPAVIVAYGPQATRAVLAADAQVPVVAILSDFVASGFAAALAHPGGRVTGISFLGTPLNTKRLELLAEVLPEGGTVLNLADATLRGSAVDQAVAASARSLGLVSHVVYAGTPQDIDAAFASARRLRVSGVNVLNSPFLNSNRARIIDLAAKARLPAIYQWPQSAHDGGLMAYGPSGAAMNQQLAKYVVHILNGSKAGDLPIEQPTKFELVINLKTARALGLVMPQSLLLRADEVIE
jgi:putative ABC transport system substrate-binding protein